MALARLQITFLVGVLWFIVGALQLGFLARFLSHSVISGFTTGAALTIGLSQLKYILGIKARSPALSAGCRRRCWVE